MKFAFEGHAAYVHGCGQSEGTKPAETLALRVDALAIMGMKSQYGVIRRILCRRVRVKPRGSLYLLHSIVQKFHVLARAGVPLGFQIDDAAL